MKRCIHVLIGMALAAICIGGAHAAASHAMARTAHSLLWGPRVETGSPDPAKTKL